MKITVELDIRPDENASPEYVEAWKRAVVGTVVNDIVKTLHENRASMGERGVDFRLYTDDIPVGAVPTWMELLEFAESFTDEKINLDLITHFTLDKLYHESTVYWVLRTLLEKGLVEQKYVREFHITQKGRREVRAQRGDYGFLFERLAEKAEDEAGE